MSLVPDATPPAEPPPATGLAVSGPRVPHLVALAACFILVVVLYANTIHGPPQFDDRHTYALQTFEQVKDQAFHQQFPQRVLVNLTFVFNYWLGGVDTFGYHVLNMAVHLLTGFCLFGLLYDLLRLARRPPAPAPGDQPAGGPAAMPPLPGEVPTSTSSAPAPEPSLPWIGDRQALLALGATLVLLCHPLATQSVSYIVQRYTSIATLFCVLAVWCYCRARRLQLAGCPFSAPAHLAWYATAIVAGLAAMFSKEFPIALPGLVILVELVLIQRDARRWADRLLYALPVLLTAVAIPLIYSSAVQSVVDPGAVVSAGGEANGGWAPESITRLHYLQTQCEVVPFTYLRLLMLPVGQSLEHSVNLATEWSGRPALGALIIGLLLVGGLVACRWAPFIGVGLLWLLGTLVPTSSVLPNHILVAEHRMYLPMLGLAFVLVGLAEWRPGWWNPARLLAATAVLVLVLGATTIVRNRVWADSLLLWQDTVQKAGDQPRAHFALGYEYEIRGRYGEALTHYDEALRLSPRYSDARHNRGNALQGLGRREEAVAAYKYALEVEPNRTITWGNMAVVLGELGRNEEALAAARAAIAGRAESVEGVANPTAHYTAGLALQRLGRLQEARDEYLLTLQADPGHLEAQFNLGLVAYALGDRKTAMAYFTSVINAQPDHAGALIGFGTLLADAGRLDQAAAVLQHASTLPSPQRAEALRRLGQVRSNQHDWPAAISALQEAVALAPAVVLNHLLLAEAYTAAGNPAAAHREAVAAQSLGVAIAPASLK